MQSGSSLEPTGFQLTSQPGSGFCVPDGISAPGDPAGVRPPARGVPVGAPVANAPLARPQAGSLEHVWTYQVHRARVARARARESGVTLAIAAGPGPRAPRTATGAAARKVCARGRSSRSVARQRKPPQRRPHSHASGITHKTGACRGRGDGHSRGCRQSAWSGAVLHTAANLPLFFFSGLFSVRFPCGLCGAHPEPTAGLPSPRKRSRVDNMRAYCLSLCACVQLIALALRCMICVRALRVLA